MTNDELLRVESDAMIEHWGGDVIALANADDHEVAAVGRRAIAKAAWDEGEEYGALSITEGRVYDNPYRVSPEGTT